ncbi:gem-associated protein 8-like [Zophobas morio]|uniref:gem-associated protein 8-like n=1 Tax=Zophobas morio TaxID=2755281 RepID=UPI003082F13E
MVPMNMKRFWEFVARHNCCIIGWAQDQSKLAFSSRTPVDQLLFLVRCQSRLVFSKKQRKFCVKWKVLKKIGTSKVVDVTDMEWSSFVPASSIEVAEWHKHEQIAYWKSRALSLEYENKMLLQHIRNVYAKQTEDYANYLKDQGHEQIEEASPVEEKREETREPVGKKRREEMEQLYGAKASKIMGMETAVQLNYDLHLEDAGKLSHWPHTPLNLRFDD